ncbi:MAG TPA: helix-turn-helix domain-containing protein [Treponemataceae bacterium]|nr:helix-turn-helix domain-containing protein [Treponemataceae bacterium]
MKTIEENSMWQNRRAKPKSKSTRSKKTTKLDNVFSKLIQSHYKISKEDLFSDCRKPQITEPRQLHWLILRRKGYTLKSIGDMYNRNYSTVYSGIKHIECLIDSDKKVREFYQKVINELKRESILEE